MKKILVVNNNMEVGGIQRSLLNFLKEMSDDFDISLALFSKSGALFQDIPQTVKIVDLNRVYSILGEKKDRLKKRPFLFCLKAICVVLSRVFGKRPIIKMLGWFQKKISGFDVVISYSHLTSKNTFDVGTAEFVLDKTVCDRKVCLIHCDYQNSGLFSEYNNDLYSQFDKIACCSDSVKERFLALAPALREKTFTQRNFYDFDIRNCMGEVPVQYDCNFVNLVVVARVSAEKGIMRLLNCLVDSKRKDIRVYIIGDGPEKPQIELYVDNAAIQDKVFFEGEQINPYKYIKNADYLVLPSFHEAAPIVFDEAKILGTPVISSNTTSAKEMLGRDDYIFDNNQELTDLLLSLKQNTTKLSQVESNQLQRDQFDLIAGF